MKKSKKTIRIVARLFIAFASLVSVHGWGLAQEAKIQSPGNDKRYMIIEGDILVPVDFYKNRIQATWRQNRLWSYPRALVPFQFNANVTAANRNFMLAAMAEWEKVANVDFIPRTNEDDWVEIFGDTVNSAQLQGES